MCSEFGVFQFQLTILTVKQYLLPRVGDEHQTPCTSCEHSGEGWQGWNDVHVKNYYVIAM